MINMDIKKLLEENSPIVDKIIEKYIPRNFTKKSIEFMLGKPSYGYTAEPLTKALSEPIWNLLDRGGKRWRPALFLLIVEALGGDPEKVFDFVIIPEVVHNGTLVTDDVEDNSDFRRGKPCLHKIFGNDIAINAGESMYYLPTLVFLKNKDKFPAEVLLNAYEIYVQEMIRVTSGQATDIAWHKGIADADNISENEYLQMCANKTGCLARMSAKLGALLAGGSEKQIEKLGKLAETIGVAFQIQDDILNLSAASDSAQFVKEYIGSDISEGKRTLLIIHTLKNANEKDRKRLLKILKMHTKDKKIIEEAISIIKKYDSFSYAKEFARKMVRNVWVETDKLLPNSEAKEKLKAFADYLVERDI